MVVNQNPLVDLRALKKSVKALEELYVETQLDGWESAEVDDHQRVVIDHILVTVSPLPLDKWWVKNNHWLLDDDAVGGMLQYYLKGIKRDHKHLILPLASRAALAHMVSLYRAYCHAKVEVPVEEGIMDHVFLDTDLVLAKRLRRAFVDTFGTTVQLTNEDVIYTLHDAIVRMAEALEYPLRLLYDLDREYDGFNKTYRNRN